MLEILLTVGKTGDAIMQIGLMLIIFIIVLALAYYVSRFVGMQNRQISTKKNIKIVESAHISQGKLIQIVSIGKKYFILGVTKDNIQLIGEIQEEDLDLSESDDKIQFRQILANYMPSKMGDKKDNEKKKNK